LGSANVAHAALTAQAHDLITRSALDGVLARITPVPAPEEALLAVHTAEYLDRLRAASAGGPWDGEYAPVTSGTWDAARLTVGGVLAAVDAVLEGRVRRALVHARPAGHHAEPDRAIASTYLNNVACGVEHARSRGVERVAIIDWDVHHGNGTEELVRGDPALAYVSLHQWPLYPGSGGPGSSAGNVLNIPLAAGSGDAEYRTAFRREVAPFVRRFEPDLVVVSAGFDAFRADPLAGMELTAAGFRGLAADCAALAPRIAAVLEGGYVVEALPELVEAAVEGFEAGAR
jgi:acetoin utilization deacetylase AcuC-like enzyme